MCIPAVAIFIQPSTHDPCTSVQVEKVSWLRKCDVHIGCALTGVSFARLDGYREVGKAWNKDVKLVMPAMVILLWSGQPPPVWFRVLYRMLRAAMEHCTALARMRRRLKECMVAGELLDGVQLTVQEMRDLYNVCCWIASNTMNQQWAPALCSPTQKGKNSTFEGSRILHLYVRSILMSAECKGYFNWVSRIRVNI
jgi:hypothetical protein